MTITLKYWVYIVWCYNCDDWITINASSSPDLDECPIDNEHFINDGSTQFYEEEIDFDLDPIDLRPMYHKFCQRRNYQIIKALYNHQKAVDYLIRIYAIK